MEDQKIKKKKKEKVEDVSTAENTKSTAEEQVYAPSSQDKELQESLILEE